ncbi:hypothetical protein FPV67DRAFT_284196 [Lyophyllum atratum]|nr:hypothetical protein FPV67DRAFT_284196 [Lyophyllum atratum]
MYDVERYEAKSLWRARYRLAPVWRFPRMLNIRWPLSAPTNHVISQTSYFTQTRCLLFFTKTRASAALTCRAPQTPSSLPVTLNSFSTATPDWIFHMLRSHRYPRRNNSGGRDYEHVEGQAQAPERWLDFQRHDHIDKEISANISVMLSKDSAKLQQIKIDIDNCNIARTLVTSFRNQSITWLTIMPTSSDANGTLQTRDSTPQML